MVGVRPWRGCQTLVHPTQTCRHPNKVHERKEKPVHHGFHNEEAYPMWHQTLVHPMQICRHPNKLHAKKEKPCFVIVGIRPWYTPRRQPNKLHAKKKKPFFRDHGCQTLVQPTQTHRHPNKLHERKEKKLCIMASTTKKHIHCFKTMGMRPWYTPRRPVDIQTNHQRGRGNQRCMVSTIDYPYKYS